MKKLTALATACALAAATLAPTGAEARDRRDGHGYYQGDHDRDGYYNDRRHDDYYGRGRHRRDRDDDDDAIAAGVLGLVLGLALGAAVSQPPEPQARCSDDYRYCEPPRRQGSYDPRYDDNTRSAYERDYGAAPAAQCMRREWQWDRYANRYVNVDVPC